MGIAGAFHLTVKMCRVLGVFDAGVQIRPAAKPRGAGGPEHAGVHMDGRGMRVDHMRHQRDARGPEPRVILHARHAPRGHGLLRARAQSAMHLGPVDANLFKDPAAAQDRHDTAAAIFGAAGRGDLKGHGRFACRGGADLQLFKGGHDPVAQGTEPGGGAGLFGGEIVGHRGSL